MTFWCKQLFARSTEQCCARAVVLFVPGPGLRAVCEVLLRKGGLAFWCASHVG